MIQSGWILKLYAKGKNPATTEHILYNSIYMKCTE